MKSIIIITMALFFGLNCYAQNPVGKWKKISVVSSYKGETFDSHKALLTQRPCAAKIVYKINADGTYRLDASASGCDESYKKIQEKLWSETKWKLDGNKMNIYAIDPSLGDIYTVTFSGNKMIWKNEYDVITYQKL